MILYRTHHPTKNIFFNRNPWMRDQRCNHKYLYELTGICHCADGNESDKHFLKAEQQFSL